MRRALKILGLFLILSLFSLAHLSCTTVAKSSAVNEGGTFTRVMPARAQRVSVASQAALEGLDLRVMNMHATETGYVIVARDFHDKQVTVIVEDHGNNSSKVGVHAEPTADQKFSISVLDAIQDQLNQ